MHQCTYELGEYLCVHLGGVLLMQALEARVHTVAELRTISTAMASGLDESMQKLKQVRPLPMWLRSKRFS